jgi:hypothetical protein
LTHQGGGEPLCPMPLEITRCLREPGAEIAPPLPRPVRRGPTRVLTVDTTWPNGQACHSCGRRHLMPAFGCQWRLRERYPRHALVPRPGRLHAPCMACRRCHHYSRVRCSFPLTVIGPERGYGSSPSMTLRRPIASSIDIVERSSINSIERAICLYFSGMQRKSF